MTPRLPGLVLLAAAVVSMIKGDWGAAAACAALGLFLIACGMKP